MEQNTLRRRVVGLTGIDREETYGGYTLFAPLTDSTAYLVNIDGEEVHRWNLPGRTGRHVRLLPTGNLAANTLIKRKTYPFMYFHKYGGGVMSELDAKSNVVRQQVNEYGHHDAFHYPDGRILYASLEAIPAAEAGVVGGVAGTEEDGVTYMDVIREVSPEGELLFEWRISKSLPREEYPLHAHYTREHYPLINSLYPLRDGNILASLRSVSAVIIISKTTGEIIWSIKAPLVNQQHNATELDNGNILIFDNGVFRPGESIMYSRVIEVDRKTKKIVWEYTDQSAPQYFFTAFMGSAQRLPNGNTLISDCSFGRIFEVTKEKKIVWEYVVPYFKGYENGSEASGWWKGESNAVFRAYRYAEDELPQEIRNKLASKKAITNGH